MCVVKCCVEVGYLVFEVDFVGLELFCLGWVLFMVVECFDMFIKCVVVGGEYVIFFGGYGFCVMKWKDVEFFYGVCVCVFLDGFDGFGCVFD